MNDVLGDLGSSGLGWCFVDSRMAWTGCIKMAFPSVAERACNRYYIWSHDEVLAEVETEEQLLVKMYSSDRFIPEGAFACRLSDGLPMYQYLRLPDGELGWVYIATDDQLPKPKKHTFRPL